MLLSTIKTHLDLSRYIVFELVPKFSKALSIEKGAISLIPDLFLFFSPFRLFRRIEINYVSVRERLLVVHITNTSQVC
jgi:hypothetical protein